jgi:prevent-host-death family protein
LAGDDLCRRDGYSTGPSAQEIEGVASYSVAEAKDRLPALLDAAERGEQVTITRGGKPVAELRPVQSVTPKRVSPESIDALERVLAAFPPQEVDAGAYVRAMRDADDEA